jgi:ATP/maltotriose-dependent transcriptional regulator MalT
LAHSNEPPACPSPAGDGHLAAARDSRQRRAWREAHDLFVLADRESSLSGDDLEYLAECAYLIGLDEDYLATLERAHHAYRNAGDCRRAARCAFWLGFRLFLKGATGPATGWLSRSQRLIEQESRECVDAGYLLIPLAQRHAFAGEIEQASAIAARAIEIGEHHAEPDLVACARHLQGRVLLQRGDIERGLALLDETMVSVVAGELSPIVTGLIYCSVIEGCQEVYALERAREWTGALERWCAAQPEMVAFSGVCLVHRAEVLQFQGAWQDASAEAQRAHARCVQAANERATAAADYQRAEIHRLHGDFEAAEEGYRSASRRGVEPLPGLALLRIAQGRIDAALAALHRALGTTTDPLRRVRLLPSCVEASLLAGAVERARAAEQELASIARAYRTDVMRAMAEQARGEVDLAAGDASSALCALRGAWEIWERVEAPYAAARVRVLMGLACRALGDVEGSALELDAARDVFERLHALPDVARVDALATAKVTETHGLSRREIQVLRLVATGMTNRMIAAELSLSEKTIERHVSNILTKLDVPSRAAATAYAYEHSLI